MAGRVSRAWKCAKNRPGVAVLVLALVALAAYLVYRAATTRIRVEGWTFRNEVELDESDADHMRHINQVKKLCGQGWTWTDIMAWKQYAYLSKYNGDQLYEQYCKPAQDAITAQARLTTDDTVAKRTSKCKPGFECKVKLLKAGRPCMNTRNGEPGDKCCQRVKGIRKSDGKKGWILTNCAWIDRAQERDEELTTGKTKKEREQQAAEEASGKGVDVYGDAGFKGNRNFYPVGRYTGIADGISSIKVPAGFVATVYTEPGMKGKGATLSGNVSNLNQDKYRVDGTLLNDNIRSMVVRKA